MNTRTNLPSVARAQSRFYRDTPTRELKIEQSVYDLVFKSNKDNMNWPAVKYLSQTWTFKDLKAQTDQLADAFTKAGLKMGDTVLVGLSNSIEVVLCLLAINRIGAVSKWIDIRATVADVKENIAASKCRMFVAFENLVPLLSQLDSSCGLELIITVSPVEMSSTVTRAAFAVKTAVSPEPELPQMITEIVDCNIKIVRFRNFIRTGDSDAPFVQPEFDESRPSIIVQSSGTTGKPKIIVHSDYSATSSAWSFTYSDLPTVVPKARVLLLLPPWIAYSLGQAIICCLSCGACIIMDPMFHQDDALVRHLDDNFTACCGVPLHYRYLYENFSSLSPARKEKIYNASAFITGGDKLSPDENKAFDEMFRTPVVNGYGNNESWGCITVNSTKDNHYGSVGIPKYGETVISYSNEMRCELPVNEVGEICVKSNSMFLCYDGNMDETFQVKKLHSDGNVWLHTGDLGIIDEDGFIYLKGRIRRVITRRSYKISAYTIEDVITSLPMVNECVAVEVKDDKDGGVPMVFVVLNDVYRETDVKVVESLILSKCRKELKDYEIPKYLQFREMLPYTSNKKYDFKRLEEDGNSYVDSLQGLELNAS